MIYLISLLLSLNMTVAPPDEPVEWLGETTFDMGDILRGEDHVHIFKFRNLTDAPILVENVRVGCGCTATDWNNVPVAPGEVGSINVRYDAMNAGYFRKYVKVFFYGHRGGHKLWLEGFVEN
ncbi:DUF1573 domain-containing protein [Neolewinella aurantiaca]|uniref:DUF1573 domain-containing protein n=1 Tax=Neolewinella aurantiaca TaxID=2602767 RepID=A0A5C7FY81_9BACT|nr:DUF1573 domain-containing protein [Neolewinella aurantiaca]TXF91811.1 DUF1573 domain-containing protein [Neolewinella aurantiaca]